MQITVRLNKVNEGLGVTPGGTHAASGEHAQYPTCSRANAYTDLETDVGGLELWFRT